MNLPLVTALIGSATAFIIHGNTTYRYNQDIENLEKAKKVAEKVSNIKERVSINNISNTNSIIVDDSSIISDTSKISHLLVPTNATKYDEELLDKHFQATSQYLKTNYTDTKPDCNQLETTGLITLEQCNYISAKEFNFFSYNNGEIEYQLPKEIANKVVSLSKAEVDSDIDASTVLIKDNDNFLHSEYMEKRIYDLTFKYNEMIDSYVESGDVDYAKELNKKLETFNPQESAKNTTKYSW